MTTERARRRALACGVPASISLVTGLPVSACFVAAAQQDPVAVPRRRRLQPDLPVVLVAGGADGMGPFRRLCRTLVDGGLDAQLALIVHRNERLRAALTDER